MDETTTVIPGLVSGTLTVADTVAFVAPFDFYVTGAAFWVATAPTGAALKVNLKVNQPTVPGFRGTDYGAVNPTVNLAPSGTKQTLYSTDASIAISTFGVATLGAPDALVDLNGNSYAVAKGSLLYVAVTQIGSTVAGANLSYTIGVKKR